MIPESSFLLIYYYFNESAEKDDLLDLRSVIKLLR